MNTTTSNLFAEFSAIVVDGPLREVQAVPGGGWVITPQIGTPLVIPGNAEAAAYIERATRGTGPAALAPAVLALPVAVADAEGDEETAVCGCVPLARTVSPERAADLMQARQIGAGLAEFGVVSARRSVTFDEEARAAVVRVASDHGLYVLRIPRVHNRFTVYRDGRRDGQLDVRRVPGTSDSMVTALFAAYLRARAAL